VPAKSKVDRQSTNARDTLIEAAIEEFSRNGYAATTLAAIAQKIPELGGKPRIVGFNYDTGERYLEDI